MRHMDDRLCDTSTTSRKKPKTCHIVRHLIKVPQTMAWGDSQHRGWINSAGLGLDPRLQARFDRRARGSGSFARHSEGQ
jgi:hypothetical protein